MTNTNRTILVTGGAGFIGSNFVTYMVNTYPDYNIINLDKLTYAGSLDNLIEIENKKNYTFLKGDISDAEFINSVFESYPITDVIHLAAESHVDRSIKDGTTFVETNVLGTFNLLQAAKKSWKQDSNLEDHRFHHISTDEIYGSLESDGMFSEETPYDPRNPYSATKASSNMLVKSFGYTYDMDIVISSCSNNYGPKQHKEKLIPTIIHNALTEQPIPIYGDGQNIRDWIYVEDHCSALDTIFHNGESMNTYNVGGRTEKTNIEIVNSICDLLDDLHPISSKVIKSYRELITFTEDRLGHDRRYAVDDSKIRETLNWTQMTRFETGLKNTIEWYVNKWKTPSN